MSLDDKALEIKLLLKRVFPIPEICEIGKEQAIPYFDQLVNCWEADPDEAALEIAQNLNEKQLQEVFKKHKGRPYAVFRGSL